MNRPGISFKLRQMAAPPEPPAPPRTLPRIYKRTRCARCNDRLHAKWRRALCRFCLLGTTDLAVPKVQ
jgi:hypothetical protein